MSEPETDLIPFRDDPEPTGPPEQDHRHPQHADRDHPISDHDRGEQPTGEQSPGEQADTPAAEADDTPQLQPAEDIGNDDATGDLVVARGLDHGSGAHRIFAGLDFRLPAGQLGVVDGTDGSGRSTLLLALTGRAPALQGSLQVAGHDAMRAAAKVRSLSAVARIGTLVDLEPKHSVLDALKDRAAIDGLRVRSARRACSELTDLLDLRVSDDDLIEELTSYQRTVLALALAAMRPSDLLVLDDADRGLNSKDQERLFAAVLQLVSHTGSTVVISTVEPDTFGYDVVPIHLPAPGRADRSDQTAQ